MFKQQLKIYWENVKQTYERNELNIDENYICIVILLFAVLSFNYITTSYTNKNSELQKQELEELRGNYEREKNSK